MFLIYISSDIDQVRILDSVPEDDTSGSTLPPTCPATDETTLAGDSTSVDKAAEFDTVEDAKPEEETTTVPTSDQAFTSISPISISATSVSAKSESTASVSGSTTKETSKKKDKIIWNKETKHENIAKEKEATKYELEEDEDGFGNDDF